MDGSFPVVDYLLDSLNQQLVDLTDLEPTCRRVRMTGHLPVCPLCLTVCLPFCLQSLLAVLHQDVVLQYVKRMMKTGQKSREQQVGGAQRMNEDEQKITDFFITEVRLWQLCSGLKTGSDTLHFLEVSRKSQVPHAGQNSDVVSLLPRPHSTTFTTVELLQSHYCAVV